MVYAVACKAINVGSIPALASSPDGGIGRRKGLKIPRNFFCAGSSPALGKYKKFLFNNLILNIL